MSTSEDWQKFAHFNNEPDFLSLVSRQTELVHPSIVELTVLIVGCGGIGSNAAIILASMGVRNFILYDDDVVSIENLFPQNFSRSALGQPKAQALADFLQYNFNVSTVEVHCQRYEQQPHKVDVVIIGVDTMRDRVSIWKFVRAKNSLTYRLWIDGRMGGQEAHVIAFLANDTQARRHYQLHELPTHPIPPLPCGQKATAYLTKGFICGIIGARVRNFVEQAPVPYKTMVNPTIDYYQSFATAPLS